MYSERQLNCSRICYILEAAFEYLISILVAESFLATLTQELGFSDSLTGIISSFISLGCLFQLFSLVLHRKRFKSFVLLMSILNQLLFLLLYVIPIVPLSKNGKTVIFVVTIFVAYFVYNFVHPKKINWFMSLIDDHRRGRFTAVKEMISLIIGMAFSYGMGAVVDYYKEIGEIKTAFIIAAGVIFLLMILHSLTMILSVEKDVTVAENKNVFLQMSSVMKDKNILKVTVLFVLWQVATYITTPFYGTYQISELGFSLKYVSLLTIASNVIRILASYFLGSYADRHSFAKMLHICFVVMGVGLLFAALSTPKNGKTLFIGYHVCRGFALGGVNSALINLVFDYVPEEKRADSLALSQAASGVAGFLATLAVSFLVSNIQRNGNTFCGIHIYAQQVTSILSILLIVIILFYTVFAIIKKDEATAVQMNK